MSHSHGWMSGWAGSTPWVWAAVGLVVVVLLVVVIVKLLKKSSAASGAAENQTRSQGSTSMLIELSTRKTVSEVAAALQVAVPANRFGVLHVHNLKETMAKKGVEFAHECLIFEVCQPQQAKKVLEGNMSVSTALPCRISIYEQGGQTVLATLRPTATLALFDTPQLAGVAQEVEATIVKIMNEAAAG
jgi:uncharacterized protein (DUF302 family)